MEAKIGSPLIYLSSPHSHIDPFVREQRYWEAMRALHFFMLQGHVVFSPIVHSHVIANTCCMPKVFSFWEHIDYTFISHCNEVWVLMIDGWSESKGVREEIDFALRYDRPVRYFKAEKVTDSGWYFNECYAGEVDPLLKHG